MIVRYRSLSLDDKSKLRCGAMMGNKLQCPTHATEEVLNMDEVKDANGLSQYLCEYHYLQASLENNGLEFQEDKTE